MKAKFNIWGSKLPNWVNPSNDAIIIDRALNRLNKLAENGIVKTSSGPYFIHFIYQSKSGKTKIATYRDKIIEIGEESFACVSLTFSK